MVVTVKDILHIDAMKKCRLLAGRTGLCRKIRFINAMEQPDIADWIRKDELMITTGYVIRNNEQALLQLIVTLNNKQAAGLVIKEQFLGHFPQKALELADDLSFPLICWPDDMAFVELSNPLMAALITTQNEMIESTQKQLREFNLQTRHNSLFNALLAGNIRNHEEFKYKAKLLHWPDVPLRLVILDGIDFTNINNDMNDLDLLELGNNIAKIIAVCLNGVTIKYVIIKNSKFVCIVHEISRKKLDSILKDILERINKVTASFIGCVISKQITNLFTIPELYQETEYVINIKNKLKLSQRIVYAEDMQTELFLYDAVQRRTKWVENIIAPLERIDEYDIKTGGQLGTTLKILTKNLGAKKNTADEMFLHRNTLAYRIKTIEKLLDVDLDNHGDMFKLAVAVKIRALRTK